MAIPSINNLVKYINVKLAGLNWNSNWQQLILWLTDGKADLTVKTITMESFTVDSDIHINGGADIIIAPAVGGYDDVLLYNDTGILQISTRIQDSTGYLMPVGTIMPYAGITQPDGFLFAGGAAISRTTYADLFAVIGTTYGAGDNSTTFNLPDLAETIVVGAGTRGADVTEHDTYTLGQFKDDQIQGHYHDIKTNLGTSPNGIGVSSGAGLDDDNYVFTDVAFATTGGLGGRIGASVSIADGTNGTPRVGTTTHGKQIGLNYIIKY